MRSCARARTFERQKLLVFPRMPVLRSYWVVLKLLGYVLGAGLGLFLCGAGTYFTIKNILQQQSGAALFDGECFENSFFIGSDNRHPGEGAYDCGGENNPDSFYNQFYVPTCLEGRIECSQYGAC